MTIPTDLQYTDTQEWVRLEGESAAVGITDDLQGKLGDVNFIELPQIGSALKCGDLAVILRSGTSAHVLNSPVSGTVLAVNTAAADNPATVNSDPFGAGWLFRLKVEAGEEIEHLRDADTYQERLNTAQSAEAESP